MFNPLAYPICLSQPLRLPDDPSTPNWVEHVPFAMLLVELARPRSIVELGTHAGISYCGFCQAVHALGTDTRCYAIDTWEGDSQAGDYGPEVLQDLRAHHDPRYSGFSRLIQTTFDEALEKFPDRSIDLLHIDGCHTYEQVKHDFESWLPKLSDRAIVLLHDTSVRERQFGVWKLWQELSAHYPHCEFNHGNGLGLLVIDQYPTDAVRQLVETESSDWAKLRQFFFQLGSRLTTQYQLGHNITWLKEELTKKELHVQNLERNGAANEQHVQNLQTGNEELRRQLGASEQHSKNLEQINAQRQQQCVALTQRIEQLASEIQHNETRLANRVRAVEVLTVQVRDKDTHIRNMESILADREHQIRTLMNERNRLAQRLNSIEGRASWQLLYRLWEVQMRVAAPSTIQGRAWLKMTRGARRILPGGVKRKPGGIPAQQAQTTEGPVADQPNDALPEPDENYEIWLSRNEPTAEVVRAQRTTVEQFTYQPLVSIITPTYQTPIEILRETIASVQAQTYGNWELCIVDGASADPAIQTMLSGIVADDARIRVEYLPKNLGISGNSNAAAALARGEFIALLDHDDTFAPNALFEVVQALNEHPETDIVYFDEDKISEDGLVRSEPFFKPGWSPELLLSANYLMHSVIRRTLFEAVGGFAEHTEGAQDWDLMLRCTEHTAAIVHIPKILYHWRQMIGSTAMMYEAKPYVFENQLRIVAEHLQRTGVTGAQTRFVGPGRLQALWPTSNSRVSIVIPTKEKVELLRPCLNSLLQKTTYKNYEVILVDNGSQAPETIAYYAELRDEPRVQVLDYAQPFNYSAANNFGAASAEGDILLFLNNDIEILDPDWLEELVRWVERPDIGAVGTKLLYPDGRIQHAGVVIGMEGHASHIFWGSTEHYSGIFGSVDWYRDYMAVTGACMMVRRTVFEQIGGFDEGYELAFSDIEICLRLIEAGYRNVYTPFAPLRHHEGGSRGQHIPVNDILLGYEQMHELVEHGDRYFNPNLSYASRVPILVPQGEESRSARLRRLCGLGETGAPEPRGLALVPPGEVSRQTVSAPSLKAASLKKSPQIQALSPLPYQELFALAGTKGTVLHRSDIYGSGPPNDTANPEVLALLTRHSQAPILDVGCGIGAYVAALNERGLETRGLEVDQAYVATGQSLGRPIALYDGERLPFADAQFDTVIAIEVLEHIPDWERTLHEMIRVARRCVLLSVPNIAPVPELSRHLVVPWHILEASHLNFFSESVLKTYLGGLPGISSTVSTYGAFKINGETFHNHIFATIYKTVGS